MASVLKPHGRARPCFGCSSSPRATSWTSWAALMAGDHHRAAQSSPLATTCTRPDPPGGGGHAPYLLAAARVLLQLRTTSPSAAAPPPPSRSKECASSLRCMLPGTRRARQPLAQKELARATGMRSASCALARAAQSVLKLARHASAAAEASELECSRAWVSLFIAPHPPEQARAARRWGGRTALTKSKTARVYKKL